MKKIRMALWSGTCLFGLLTGQMAFAQDTIATVAISQIATHQALEADYRGIMAALEKAGLKSGENVRILHEVAQNDPALLQQIAEKFAGEEVDVLVGIATPAAKAMASAAHGETPVVFSAVTDPVAAGLVTQLEKPNKNITGVSDAVSLSANVDLIKALLPKAKTIGTVYNPAEVNAEATISELGKLLSEAGMQLVARPVHKADEVLAATRSFVGQADALFITLDNTAASAFEAIVQVAEQAKIPVFAADTTLVKDGAVAAFGIDYFELGLATGEQIVAILKGENVEQLPVKTLPDLKLHVNLDAAKKVGLTFSDTVLEKAVKVD